jgi:hypothetical protein
MIKLSELVNELKLTDDIRIHMSKTPYELEQRTFAQKVTVKPFGFWYGFGGEWIDWCRSEMSSKWTGKYIYSVDIGNINILRIKTHMELMQFNREYQPNDSSFYPALKDGEAIDWKKVVNKYDGIEINPYQSEARYQYMWYYGWDVASGCVWNLNNVKLKLVSDKGIK